MVARSAVVLLALVAAVAAVPASLDPIISKLDPEGLRYGYLRDDEGTPHLVDSWIKASDLRNMARYNPDTDNEYHLYTRSNPLIRQQQALKSNDAVYTEVIHTNIGNIGVEAPCGDVDFYPNGGINMPGCATAVCDHYRSYFYMGESLATGGFVGTQCASLEEAKAGTCSQAGRLNMGGILPKTGSTGIYYVRTNASPPFSQ
ncbi:hypothetical protein PYW07_012754 [Mythimna separata]|uniref:Lipase domain-containing protein n=1 Tax=Mythimna separata TaxID=271217 RepID=A0AAD7Y900_MYTSE|nr:hypothetical protein PYW07_012754 [Mythimna separata]